MNLDRRAILGFVATAGAAPAAALAARSDPPALLSQDKFFPNGRVRPFRGNTILCHYDQQGPNNGAFHALLDIYRDISTLPFAAKIVPLPPSSYHMTVFVGANDPVRQKAFWPQGVPLDASIETCSSILAERLSKASFPDAGPIRMRIDVQQVRPDARPLTLRLAPADEREEQKLRGLRDQLSQVLRLRLPKHDEYRFHTTLAYPLIPLDPSEQRGLLTRLLAWHHRVASSVPVIEFGRPEYCLLEDMFAFDRQFYLA